MKPVTTHESQLASQSEVRGDLMHPVHGGGLIAVSRMTGLDLEDLLDFSVNVNPLGPPGCVQEIFSRSMHLLTQYPEPCYEDLKQAISNATGVPTDWVAIGNGSTELIYLLPDLLDRGKQVLIVSPCFSEYERAFQPTDCAVKHFILDSSNGFSLPIDKFLFQLQQFPDLGGIVIGHPNNPTGTLLAEESFRTLSAFCERRGIFLFIDETFIDFSAPESSFLKYTSLCPHLVLIRSMTKFYSLPGLRLGYAIMNPERVKTLEAHQPPWSVNALAQAMGPALLTSAGFAEATCQYVQREKEFLCKNLSEAPSVEIFPSQANFILFRLREGDDTEAKHFFEALLHQGIVLRNCGNFKGLNPGFFRLAIRSRIDNQLLVSRIHEFFQKNGV
ncbi:MAG: threonine-phosphate decarboxylase [Nitrospinaceae bacterium]|nr:MAG: threonine-phosphate decarboxylase [Nitrospinaceae bacterium]